MKDGMALSKSSMVIVSDWPKGCRGFKSNLKFWNLSSSSFTRFQATTISVIRFRMRSVIIQFADDAERECRGRNSCKAFQMHEFTYCSLWFSQIINLPAHGFRQSSSNLGLNFCFLLFEPERKKADLTTTTFLAKPFRMNRDSLGI